MSCSCSTSSSTSYIPRRYMRIDGLIFDKKYISKLEFDGTTLTVYRKGDCHYFTYTMWSEKTNVQIAEYLLELNTCDDEQVDMSTDDHSKLLNLDLDNQHPIGSIIGLNTALDTKINKIQTYTLETLPSASENTFTFAYLSYTVTANEGSDEETNTEVNKLLFSNGVEWKEVLLGDL